MSLQVPITLQVPEGQLTLQVLESKIIGKPIVNAEKLLKKLGYTMRIVEIDGCGLAYTLDPCSNRVNVKIQHKTQIVNKYRFNREHHNIKIVSVQSIC